MVSRFVFPVWFFFTCHGEMAVVTLPFRWRGTNERKLRAVTKVNTLICPDLNDSAQKSMTLGKNTQLGLEEVLAQS